MKGTAIGKGVNLLTAMLFTGGLLLIIFSFEGDEQAGWPDAQQKKYGVYALDLPATLEFAGETVPLNDYDILERLDRELLVNTYFQSQTMMFFKRANRWFPIIEPILKKNGVPDDFKYLALAESGFLNVVSPRGAAGFWQFIDKTAREYGLEVNEEVDERYHVEKSTQAACQFLLESYKQYRSWTLAAASYNMGRLALNKSIKRQKINNYFDLLLNDETSRYVFRLLAIKSVMEDPLRYGYHFRPTDLYPAIQYERIKVDTVITDLADFAKGIGINYKILKLGNPWLRNSKLTNPKKQVYELLIPVKGYGDYEYNYQLQVDTLGANGLQE
jgi:membrane-bound lytic murein transglycosylase D